MKSVQLDPTDRRLLQKTQDEFPLTAQPWKSLGDDLGISEKEVMNRLGRLFRLGMIRKIGPVLDPKRVGLRASTLIGMKVPKRRIQNVAKILGRYPEVSHCYEREHEYNLWFTIGARNKIELENLLEEIKRNTCIGEHDWLDLPSTRTFKIDVRFQLTQSRHL